MLKVMTIVGTRPEIIKLSRVIAALELHTRHILVHTGQNYDYELNQVFFEDLGLRNPDYVLGAAGETPARTIGNVISLSDEVLAKENPDAVLVYGDTNSCLAVIAAKRRKIPIFHMEAGNRCFDQRVPEEINRRIVDHISDINMTLTEHARRHLLAEGIPPQTVFKLGSSMKEVFEHYRAGIEGSSILARLGLDRRRFLVASAHREENIDDEGNFRDLVETLNHLGEKYRMPLVFITHPRTMRRIQELGVVFDDHVRAMEGLGFFDYNQLQLSAYCVISDSGTIFEESSLQGFPAVTIRNAHERPEGIDSGTLVVSGLRKEEVDAAIQVAAGDYDSGYRPKPIPDFEVDDVSHKVLRVILGYTRYVKRTVWRC